MTKKIIYDGQLLHFGSLRLRATGSGILRTSINSLDNVHTLALPNLTLSPTTNREPIILANFIEQRASVKFTTTDKDARFVISKVVIYNRPVSSSYPQ